MRQGQVKIRQPRDSRNVLLLAGGTFISVFGTALTALVVLVEFSSWGPWAVSGALLCELLPIVVGAPVVGRLVDRYSNRRLMIAALTLQAFAVLLLALSLEQLPVAMVALFLIGCGTAVVSPAAASLVPRAVGEEQATRAYSHIATGRTIGSLLGAGTGGILLDHLGARVALVVDAASFACFALLSVLLTVDRVGAHNSGNENGAKSRGQSGLRLLRANRLLVCATSGLAAMVLGTVLVNVAEVFFVKEVLGLGATTLGVLTATWGVGALIGVRLAGRLSSDRQLLQGLVWGGAAMGASLLATGAIPLVWVNLGCWLLAGAANGVQNVSLQALARSTTPEPQRGRVFAAVGACLMSANVVGTISAALVVAAWGSRVTMILAGLLTVVAAGTVWALARNAAAPQASDLPSNAPDDGRLADLRERDEQPEMG